MRFEFSRPSGEGLPVIPVVPNHRLSTIEGRNGIGKTLAARILEFITGNQPFAALPKAWDSLCDDLGMLVITIREFPGGEVIRCELDSSKWVGRKESACVGDPGLAFIDDLPVDWKQVRNLIQVRRIAGDEGLAETLARTLREQSVYARGRDADTSGILSLLAADLADLTDDLAQVRTAGHDEDVESYREATRQLQEAEAAAVAAATTHDSLAMALERQMALSDTLERLPLLLSGYSTALERYNRAEELVGAADHRLTEFGKQQVVSADNEARVAWLIRRLPHRVRQLANASVEEQSVHLFLGIEDRLPARDILIRSRDISARIKALEEENKSGFLAGAVREVQNTIEDELRSMSKAAQQEHIATVGRDIKAVELANGIAARRKQLEGVPKPDDVARRERMISDLRSQESWLDLLDGVYKKTDRKSKLVDEGTSELLELRGVADQGGDVAEAHKEAAAARAELTTSSFAVREARAAIDAAVGLEGATPPEPKVTSQPEIDDSELGDEELDEELPAPENLDEVESSLVEWLSTIEPYLNEGSRRDWITAMNDRGNLSARIGKAHEVVSAASTSLANDASIAETKRVSTAQTVSESREAQLRIQEIVALRLERLDSALRALHDQGGPWSAYRPAVDAVLARRGLSKEEFDSLAEGRVRPDELLSDDARRTSVLAATRAVETIAEIAVEVEASAARVRDQWSIAFSYLYKFSGDLSPRLDESPFDTKSMRKSAEPVLTAWVERTVGELLSGDELRAQLFDNSPSVSFNISDLTVSWIEADTKRKRRRPIEAFSSGEQVFAYTRAKLERLGGLRNEAKQVVVFLDEFGAFVARDRFAQLVTYIEHDALGAIADQIVITVPLSADLEQVRDNAAIAGVEAELIDPPGYVVIPARTE